jgi:hypothetical protein
VQQSAGQSQALALALRQDAGEAAAQVIQLQPFEHRVAQLLEMIALQAPQSAVGVQMLAHGQFWPQWGTFRQPAKGQSSPFGVLEEVLTLEPDSPFIGSQRPRDHGQRGGLASPVHPKQAKHLPGFEAQAEVAHGRASGAQAADVLKLQYGR